MKVPSGQETYLFPTIDVGPSRSYSGGDPANTGEYGLEPGVPTAESGNRTRETLGVRGSLREASRDLLPVAITIEGRAAYQAGLQSLVDRELNVGDIRIEDILRQVARGKRLAGASAVQVPRFSVQYHGDAGVRGVDVDFRPDIGLATGGELSNAALTGTTAHDFYPVGAPAGGYTQVIGPALVVDRRGRAYCFALVKKAGAPSADFATVVGWRYDQSTDTGWNLVVDIGDLYNTGVTPTSSYVGSVALVTPTIAACLHQNDVYVVVMDAGVSASLTHQPGLHLYRLRESDDTLRYVAGPVHLNRGYGILADGGVAVCSLSDRLVVAVGGTVAAGLFAPEQARAIWVGASTDLVTWPDQTQHTGGFAVLDDFASVLPPESDGSTIDQTVNDIVFLQPDGLLGWAVCQSGRIYHSIDGGATWVLQDSPVTSPLYAVSIIGGSDDAVQAVAVGASGAVLLTIDSGATWKVVSISSALAADIDDDRFVTTGVHKSRKKIGDQTLYDCVFQSDGRGWVVGENTVAYATNILSDNAEDWYPIVPKETRGTYTSVVLVDGSEAATILIGGILTRQRTKAGDKDTGEYRFLRITNARKTSSTPSYGGGDYTFHAQTDEDSAGMRIEAMAQYAPWGDASATTIYACGRGGQLLGTTDGGATWTAPNPSVPTDVDCVDLLFRRGQSGGEHELLVLAADGRLFRTRTTGQIWLTQHVATETSGQVVTTPQTGKLIDIADEDEGIILVGGGSSCYRTDQTAKQQALPALVALSGSEAILATADLAQGRIDLRRTLDRGQTWASVNVDGSAQLTFPAQDPNVADDLSYIRNTSLRPSAFMNEAGQLMVTGGSTAIVSPDGRGEEWVTANAPKLPLPVGTYDSADATVAISRSTLAFGGGRLLSVHQTGTPTIHTRTANEWTLDAVRYMPVQAGLAQWVGVDDLRVVFSAADLPVGEAWSIPATFRYAASHLVLPWRSHYWRGPTGVASAITHIWDAGAGQQFHVDACALIGANFREAKVALSRPDYLTTVDLTDSSGWGTFLDGANWTEFTLLADVDNGVVTADSDGSVLGLNVLVSNGKTWLPHQWQPLYRQYSVYLPTRGTCYRILDNAKDHLLLERTGGTIASGDPFIIVTDRMYSDGSGGARGAYPATGPIADTLYAFGRYLRLTIPAQATPDGYFKLDAFLAGTQVQLTVETPTGVLDRDGRAQGWQVSTLWSSQEDDGLEAGVTSTTVFGSAIRQWSLSHGPRYEEDVATIFRPLVGRMRRPFAALLDTDAPVDTVEMVKLVNETLDAQHAGGTLFSVPALILRESR